MKRLKTLVGVGCTVVALAVSAAAPASAAVPSERAIIARDDCNPVTFNAAIGPGACVGNGHTTFDRFIQQLQLLHQAPTWTFIPRTLSVRSGEEFRVENIGGEFHTFTEVDQFGGGVVPVLNDLSRAGPVRAECLAEASDDNIPLPPGARTHKTEDKTGSFKYMCCIHPWMHAILKVR